MGLSREAVRGHIEHWKGRLAKGNRPYRKRWPARLFRHEPLESTVAILRSGVLLSRLAAGAGIARDIAPEQIIERRQVAHNYVRLYFRPRSPTQFRIEGIRKPTELYQGRQAPVLFILVFRSEDILTRDGVEFSDGNMQSYGTETGATEKEFQAIPFELVYHDGVFDPTSAKGAEVIRRRCAEVLVPSPLHLRDILQGVLCRSAAERATLLHLLGASADQWSDRVRVYSEPGLFESRFTYLSTVDAGSEGVAFTLHPRSDGAPVNTEMWVWDSRQREIVHVGTADLNPARRWQARKHLEPGTYIARFHLEGCLAYEAPFIIDELPF